MTKLKAHAKPKKLKQSQKDKWTAKDHYAVEVFLSNIAFHCSLTKKQRDILYHFSELAGETADRLAGWTPEMQDEHDAKCAAEDAAMVARRTPKQVAAFKADEERRNAEYSASRKRSYTRVSCCKPKNKKTATRAVQLELEMA